MSFKEGYLVGADKPGQFVPQLSLLSGTEAGIVRFRPEDLNVVGTGKFCWDKVANFAVFRFQSVFESESAAVEPSPVTF